MFHIDKSAENPHFDGFLLHTIKTMDKVVRHGGNNQVDFFEHPTVIQCGDSLNLELQLAQMSVRENRNKVLIPVVLNKADVPKCIEGTLYIDCISDSEQDLCKTQLMIEKVLTHRKYIIRKGNLKEKKRVSQSLCKPSN